MFQWTGLIGKFDDGTVQVVNIELTEEEQKLIDTIARSHETDGVSVRGKADEISLTEVM